MWVRFQQPFLYEEHNGLSPEPWTDCQMQWLMDESSITGLASCCIKPEAHTILNRVQGCSIQWRLSGHRGWVGSTSSTGWLSSAGSGRTQQCGYPWSPHTSCLPVHLQGYMCCSSILPCDLIFFKPEYNWLQIITNLLTFFELVWFFDNLFFWAGGSLYAWLFPLKPSPHFLHILLSFLFLSF